MKNKFYITTAIAYVNAEPHIGFALELLQADVLARHHRLMGDDTYFLTGTDEHGSKIAQAAEKHGKDTQLFVDEIAQTFIDLTKKLNISNDDFIRTSDRVRHWPAAQKIWQKLAESGDLYKKDYEGLYCVGCEANKKKSDLEDGLCPIHKTEPQLVKEKNWFFKLSKYTGVIKEKIEKDELKIVPTSKKGEILNLLDDAEDVSFSRPTATLKWGIPVPGDDTQTMYVWTDALTNYISALGYPEDPKFSQYWPVDVHLIGKDILRFHAMYWPAILLSAGVELPKSIYVHGFVTAEGEKMSKSLGNVIDPNQLIEKYGVDVTRYFLLREIPSDDDGDFSFKKLEDRYNGDLANGLGNLVQRLVNEFKLHEVLGNFIFSRIAIANRFIDTNKPWEVIKNNPAEFLEIMTVLAAMIHNISWRLQPFMPETSQKIFAVFGDSGERQIQDNYKFLIKKGAGLFPRLQQ
ncbi:MAG: Methionine-tRNA ligase [Candidatus Yanofskybacteria bacterium GW2011_GWF1_44_227]|nr:MAG: Methionine-tRNA ligase [Candidatus Yanofskybacteria bacterium GW2011_GWF1_44_227]